MLRGASKRRRAATVRSAPLPAPIDGINTVDGGSEMGPRDAVLLFNMIAAEYGLRTRLGFREWCTGLGGLPVRTIAPFTASKKSGANDKLFAMTQTGIWDVSASSQAPAQLVVFPAQTQDSGWGSSAVVVTGAGHFLCYCDEENGLYVWPENGPWVKVTQGAGVGQIQGVDPATLAHVMVWKSRVWFTQKDTALGWYMPAGAIYGTANSINFGTKFAKGGPLAGLFNWTQDGGSGIDDSLVAISTSGDLVIYQGTDPATAGYFAIQGVWDVGAVPFGRRIATGFGGDMLVLSSRGAIPLLRLTSGKPLETSQYETFKIANLFNQLATPATLGYRGWSLALHPQDNSLLVMVPGIEGQPTTQLAMSLTRRSWSRYRDLPILSTGTWGGQLYFGTVDGRVCINDGYLDGLLLADASAYSPVKFSLLTAFRNLGNSRQKRIHGIRPKWMAQTQVPAFAAAANYDYDFTEQTAPALPANPANAWDTAVWDTATWGGDFAPSQSMVGASGMGTDVAIAIAGAATGRTILTGFDVLWDEGGIL